MIFNSLEVTAKIKSAWKVGAGSCFFLCEVETIFLCDPVEKFSVEIEVIPIFDVNLLDELIMYIDSGSFDSGSMA